MGDKSPKAKRKNDSQKQAKTDAIRQKRQQAVDERRPNQGKNAPADGGSKKR